MKYFFLFQTTVMISINAIIFSNYMIGEVYCENRHHPEHILFIRRISDIRIAKSGPKTLSPFMAFENTSFETSLLFKVYMVLISIRIWIKYCIVLLYSDAIEVKRVYYWYVRQVLPKETMSLLTSSSRWRRSTWIG